jgi:predicted phosphohydrolase
MDIFGPQWLNHAERMLSNCAKVVAEDDLLLIPGDISWALKRRDAEVDLAFISKFPGIKVLCKGNHDYWWDSDKPLAFDGLYDTPYRLSTNELGIAGTRGWIQPNSQMEPDDVRSSLNIIAREKRRLSKRLDAIRSCEKKIVITHYPPLEDFREILAEHGVAVVLYGHLHLGGSEHPPPEDWHGIKTICVAADRINFIPKLITI